MTALSPRSSGALVRRWHRVGRQFTSPLGALRMLLPSLLLASALVDVSASALALFWVAVLSLFVMAHRFDVLNVLVAFALPWMLILLFSAFEISEYSREVSKGAVMAIALVLAIAAFVTPAARTVRTTHLGKLPVKRGIFRCFLLVYLVFCVLNVALAGYVPLLRSITTGDSGYMEFGVKGLYGLFNAYANALGVCAFLLWMTNGGRLYKYTFLTVLAVFFLFVTRQNMISLLVEAFVVYNFVVRRVSGVKIAASIGLMLVAFGVIGDLRVGQDIADLAQIKEEFRWMPSPLVWLYSYCYFNILNLDNVILSAAQPLYDGSSMAQLLPSFLRPEYVEEGELLEVSSFTVNSFISPIIRDFGPAGLATIFWFFCLAATHYRRRIDKGQVFVGVTGFSVLYFCFLFSFFVNFWFYLPIIFQLIFFSLFGKLLFIARRRTPVAPNTVTRPDPLKV